MAELWGRVTLRMRSRPKHWRPEAVVADPNTLFSRREVQRLMGHVQRLASSDPRLLARLSDPRIEGIRGWEYGVLLGALLPLEGRGEWSALDVGSGNSTFPHYLVASGNVATLTTLDLPEAYESRDEDVVRRDQQLGIRRAHGSMLEIPFDDASFDLVTSISAVEHLDGDRGLHARDPVQYPRKSYEEYAGDTRQALDEMMRVVRPGGYLFLTTDAYVPYLQQSDTWSSPRGDAPIWSAYRFESIERVFLAAVHENGFELVGRPDHAVERLLEDPDRSSYRGRYFTTFCLFARRIGSPG
jgi:SAM-dependent methyltransferase